MELIPTLDLKGGRCLRETCAGEIAGSCHELGPASLMERFEALGARTVNVTDLDGLGSHAALIEELARRGRVRLQVGGGVAARKVLEATLAAGASRAVIGHLAITDPDLVAAWLKRFGAEALVVAFDVRVGSDGLPRIAVRGSEAALPLNLWDAVARFVRAGLRHVQCTDLDAEIGTAGPNLELLVEAVRRFPALEWQVAGGIRDACDLWALANGGAAAALSTRTLLGGAPELKPFLETRG